MEKLKVLITGGLGFIFSHVTEYLTSKGYNVFVIDAEYVGSHKEIVDGSFEYKKMDVSKSSVIPVITSYKPDYIIHAAAFSDVDLSINNSDFVIRKNCIATLNVFEAARQLPNLRKLVYISTDEVYGECNHKKSEEEIIFPKNPYSCSKAFGSLLRLAYDNTFRKLKNKTAETRFCNVFGERQDKTKILAAIKHGLENNVVVPIHNGGTGSREYIYVENIPEVVELVMLHGDRTYNITLNDSLTVNQLIGKVKKLTGKKVLVKQCERKGMDMKYQMSNLRILKLGWKPKYTINQGLKEYLCEK